MFASPVQGVVADALSDIIRAEAGMRTILVLTGKSGTYRSGV